MKNISLMGMKMWYPLLIVRIVWKQNRLYKNMSKIVSNLRVLFSLCFSAVCIKE